ncbi:hypothetical protein RIF29_20921 [Crotalaria pallida]|uniref:Uncharacterized protein n=1 Tax=Crotalaria pallida TaxID=3830 RepID=A0AAN9ICW6_CROPI
MVLYWNLWMKIRCGVVGFTVVHHHLRRRCDSSATRGPCSHNVHWIVCNDHIASFFEICVLGSKIWCGSIPLGILLDGYGGETNCKNKRIVFEN